MNGWFYVRPVPAGVPDNGRKPPPAPVLKVATRLLPELRRRRRIAAETIATRRWLVDARAWAAERLDWLARCDALLTIELDLLDDAALADHLQEALTLAGDMIQRHFSLLGPTVGVGRLIVAGRACGLAPDEIIPVLRGSSPASTESRRPLAELAELVLGSTRAADRRSAACTLSQSRRTRRLLPPPLRLAPTRRRRRGDDARRASRPTRRARSLTAHATVVEQSSTRTARQTCSPGCPPTSEHASNNWWPKLASATRRSTTTPGSPR